MNDDSSLPSPRSDPASPLVMLVEDDVRVRSLLAGVLDTAGFRLSAFGNPTEALAAARTLPKIDVLVTDVGLSDLSGTELADRVRELHPGAEILFMSGFAAPEEFRDRFHDHEDRFLQKPFRPAEFVARVIHFSARERWHAKDRSAPAAG
jgi:CheY-like chemotaxis protein